MITYKPTAITTDRKDSDSSVQRELSYPSRHAVFRVTQSKLPRPIKYDREGGRLTTRFQPCSIIYALSPWRDCNQFRVGCCLCSSFTLKNNSHYVIVSLTWHTRFVEVLKIFVISKRCRHLPIQRVQGVPRWISITYSKQTEKDNIL